MSPRLPKPHDMMALGMTAARMLNLTGTRKGRMVSVTMTVDTMQVALHHLHRK